MKNIRLMIFGLLATLMVSLAVNTSHAQICMDASCVNDVPKIYNHVQDMEGISASLSGVGTVNAYVITSQTYAVPSDTKVTSVWAIRCAGAGGSGGGGQALGQSPGGGAGACIDVTMNGLGPTGSISITIGRGGAAVNGAVAGNAGGSTTIVVSGTTIVAGGGQGGGNGTASPAGRGGITTGCTLPICLSLGGQGGGVTGSGPGGYGGSSCFGGGARETQAGTATADSGSAPGAGGGGGANGGANTSGSGANGICIVRRLN